MKKLTLSMIVKNEEKYLEGCLDSVKDIVDEIVIVDTGSTDKTLEIAQRYNSKIFKFEWIHDFSAARNYALSKSTGNWILYLDADERLSADSKEEVKKIIKLNDKLGVNCIVNNIDEYSGNDKTMNYVRLFKNDSNIYFKGKAHEQILESLLENGYEIIDSAIEIIHLGYNLPREELKLKAERNLKMLLDEFNESGSSYYAYQLGNTYAVLENYEKAYEYYKIALEDKNLDGDYKSVCLLNLADYEMRNGNLETSEELVLQGLKINPEHVWLHLLASQIYSALGNFDLSIQHCKTALNIRDNQKQKNSKLLEVNVSKEQVLYQAMLVSIKAQNGKEFEYFINKFVALGHNKEALMIKKMILEQTLDDSGMELINNIINKDNLEFYLTLISKLEFEKRIKLLLDMYDKFKDNTKYLLLVGLSLMEGKSYKEAEEILTHSLNQQDKDPSVIFYLISIYLETNQIKKIPSILDFAYKNFGENKLVMSKLKDIQIKLQPIIEQYQPTL